MSKRIPVPMAVQSEIDAVYAQLPKLACQRKCQECCGPVFMSAAEWRRITNRLGRTPGPEPDLTCPMLRRSTGACKVYDIRPLICRLWGVVEAMKCPFGCVPDRWLTDAESHAMIGEMARLGALTPA
jgi:uncharacterized protein